MLLRTTQQMNDGNTEENATSLLRCGRDSGVPREECHCLLLPYTSDVQLGKSR